MNERKIDSVLETCLYVEDLAEAERFYGEVLGLEFLSRREGRHVFFRVGPGMLLIFAPQQSAAGGTLPPHGTQGSGHAAFAVEQDQLPAWQAGLEQAGVAIEQIVDWPAGGRSLYFRDPAGNSLELTSPTIWGIPDSKSGPDQRSDE